MEICEHLNITKFFFLCHFFTKLYKYIYIINCKSINQSKVQVKKLIFVGHFDIGERPTEETRILIEQARKEKNAVFCVLVGDIGLSQKIKEYRKIGIEGIKGIYQTRIDCTKSKCVLSQLPQSEKGLTELIDTMHYKEILEYINQAKNTTQKNEIELIKEVLPSIIERRIEDYGFSKKQSLFITETRCRNRATNRIKPKHQKSWQQIDGFRKSLNGIYIKNQLIANENKVPVCRGVMFAFFEYMTQLGFNEIRFYLEKRHLSSIFMGWMNYWSVQKNIPYLENKIEQVKFILPQMLVNKS